MKNKKSIGLAAMSLMLLGSTVFTSSASAHSNNCRTGCNNNCNRNNGCVRNYCNRGVNNEIRRNALRSGNWRNWVVVSVYLGDPDNFGCINEGNFTRVAAAISIRDRGDRDGAIRVMVASGIGRDRAETIMIDLGYDDDRGCLYNRSCNNSCGNRTGCDNGRNYVTSCGRCVR